MVRALPRLPSLELDPKRIVANAVVIALHAAAFALLLAPVEFTPPQASPAEDTILVVLPDKKPPPPEVQIRRDPLPRQRPQPSFVPPVALPTTPTGSDLLDPLGTESAETLTTTGDPVEPVDSGPALAQLTLLSGPAPRYPREAIREGWQGEVVLRVLVDAQGRPEAVVVERSSGHRALDVAALRQVKERWRFQPMQINGQPAAAYALVPIRFSLPE